MRSGGPTALQALLDVGETPAPDDYGPTLHAERCIWRWFERLCEPGPHGPTVNRATWVQIADREGWPLGVALDMLGVIEAGLVVERST